MIISIVIFIVLAVLAVLYKKKKLPAWCTGKNGRNIFLMLLSVNSLATYLFYVDHQTEFMGKDARLERNNCGEGVRTEMLIAKTEEKEIPVEIKLPERQYSDTELEKAFESAMEELDGIILGENKTFDEVRKDLNFPSQIPGMPITVSWEVDNYEVMNVLGELQREALQKEGTIVQITGKLRYGAEERIYMRSANVFPPKLKGEQKIAVQLAEQISEEEKANPDQKKVALPKTYQGHPIQWKRPQENRGYLILALGFTGSILLVLMEKETKKEAFKEKRKQMLIDYPEILNKFVLFLGAGMTVKGAWQKIASDYERAKAGGMERFAYEEMVYTLREMQAGASEKECYEHFGKRCGTVCYMRFGALLSQNLKRGSGGLADLLRLEAVNAFEDRKRAAKKAGEEVGTKLLVPMFLMLAVVLVIVIVPAFLSMQF